MSTRVVTGLGELWLDRDWQDGSLSERRGYVVHETSKRAWAPPLFVYGSLRRGRAAASLLDRWSPVHLGEARVAGVLFDLGAYPGWAPGESGVGVTPSGFVYGELVTLPEPESALEALDAYEDFFGHEDPSSLYLRVPTRVETRREGAWEETMAWAYAWNGHGEHPIVASGCWDR